MKQHSVWVRRFLVLAAGVVVCAMLALVRSCGTPCDVQTASSAACQPYGCVEGSGTVLSATLVCSVSGGVLNGTRSRYQTLLSLPGSSSSLTVDVVTTSRTIPTGDLLPVMAVANNPSERRFNAVEVTSPSPPEEEAPSQQIVYHEGRATAPLHCLLGASGCSGQRLAFTLGGLSFQVALSAATTVLGFGTPASITPGQAVDVSARLVGGTLNSAFQVANAALTEEFQLPTKSRPHGAITSGPSAITSGSDGNLWFSEPQDNRIGRLTPNGTLTEFPLPRTDNGPSAITSGPDGNLWFTEFNGNRIGRLTPGGRLTEFLLPTKGSSPTGITSGPDGNLWFTEFQNNSIGRMTPEGTLTEFPLPRTPIGPWAITSGPDGNLWFTEFNGNGIGRLTPQGTFTEFLLPRVNSSPTAITTGPDGNLWFTEDLGNQIGRITPAGILTVFREFRLPTDDSQPDAITTGSDGNLWFTETRGNHLGRITPQGAITELLLPTLESAPGGITTGPDGALWFTEPNGNKIARHATEKEAASVTALFAIWQF